MPRQLTTGPRAGGERAPPRPAHQAGSEPRVLRRPQEAAAAAPSCPWFAPTPRPCPSSPPPSFFLYQLGFSPLSFSLCLLFQTAELCSSNPSSFTNGEGMSGVIPQGRRKGSAFPELIFTLIRNREWKAIEMTVFFPKTISVLLKQSYPLTQQLHS